ncbi:receptor-like protein EIX2 isoform X2 [Spinacia oleracea]|uniref:Receptor-like protein EIX2 isoform X2 n=1 Tax=Spinacia oleracea TaxID=3562 RepID=A0ABM3RFB5_SPIOL|nr:receptor-like protein EIX2 isoform X2 [Spinacia oleracea]
MGKLQIYYLLTIILFFVFFIDNMKLCGCGMYSNSSHLLKLGCKPAERKALLDFKSSVTFYDQFVSSSWEGEDCCSWRRVKCNPTTGHVVELRLHGNYSMNIYTSLYIYLFEARNIESSLVYLLELNHLEHLDVSINNFSYSKIPKFMGSMKQLRLSGTIPRCLGESSDLQFVDLAFNNLSGDIPCFRVAHVGWSFSSLDFVSLSDNMLSGRIPSCLANLSNLEVLDVGENNLSGEIPTFITRVNVPGLQILRLRNNKLEGSIPEQLCSLSKLQILDLGHNYLTGIIPSCLSNLTEMNLRHPSVFGFNRMADVNEIIKGTDREYTKTIGFMVNIDLSCNKLIGSIPEKITNLPSLVGLNLSYNQLSGHIPGSIGGLKSLESLDLSRNKLHGTIPTSLGAISPLEFLDLSYNNLSGQIPTGNQLQTLNDPLSYAGNPYLCGDPLSKKCKSNHDSTNGSSGAQNNEDEESEDKHETMWFYLVVMSGFATGFWCVVGTLFLNKSWRHAFFRRVEFVQDWLYVAVVVRVPKLMRRFI